MHDFKIMENKKLIHLVPRLCWLLFRCNDLLSTQAKSNLSRIISATFNDVRLHEVSILQSMFVVFLPIHQKSNNKAERLTSGTLCGGATLPPAAERLGRAQHQT